MKTKEELKSFFENGDIPKQEEFWEWQNSYWHKDEKLKNTIPLSGTVEGENVTGKIISESPTVLVANWENIEQDNKARLTQGEGLIIEKFRKNVQLQPDYLRFVDNLSDGKGILLTIDTNLGMVANRLFDLASPYQFVQQSHIQNEYYTRAQVDSLVNRLYRIKGSVPNMSALPSLGNTLGDVYNVNDTGDNYVWADDVNGIAYWDKLSGIIDASELATIAYVDEKIGLDEGGVWNFPI